MKKGQKMTPEEREKYKKAHNTPEARSNHSKASKEVQNRPDVIAKKSKSRKEAWTLPGHLEMMSNAIKLAMHRPEVWEKRERAFSDPEVKARLSKSQQIRNSQPGEHERRVLATKMAWRDPEFRKKCSGPNSPRWKNGSSYEPYCPLFNDDLKERIRAFFDYSCVICGKSTEENGRQLDCHHVEYDKQACCDGKPVQFAALCKSCHAKTGSNVVNWEEILHCIIKELYDDRSYYTTEEWNDLNTYTSK